MNILFDNPLKWTAYLETNNEDLDNQCFSLCEAISSFQELELITDYVQQDVSTGGTSSSNEVNEQAVLPSANATKRTREYYPVSERPETTTIPDDEERPAQKKPSNSHNAKVNHNGSSYSNYRNTNNRSTDADKSKPPVNFYSAKDRFIEEGGKLSNTSSSASTMIKKVMKSTSHNGQGEASSSAFSLPPELASYDPVLVEKITNEIIDHGQPVKFDDISGLEDAKQCVQEMICWPILKPSLFQGLRSLPKGILLFGPPGTGKTLIGKAVAYQSGATFFSISASSLMSKWIGEGEKTVRTLFAVAAYHQPSVVFIDEVDSLLCQRSAEENESSRRIKTEFMVQLDGAHNSSSARIVILGATNRPEELDEAVRRRFVKRIYIPLPNDKAREELFYKLLEGEKHILLPEDITNLVQRTDNYSGADIRALCNEAALGPVRLMARQIGGDLRRVNTETLPMMSMKDFLSALDTVAPSVTREDLQRYQIWNDKFGSYR